MLKLFEQFVESQNFSDAIISALNECGVIDLNQVESAVTNIQLKYESQYYLEVAIQTAVRRAKTVMYYVTGPSYNSSVAAVSAIFDSYNIESDIQSQFGSNYSRFNESPEIEDFAISKFEELVDAAFNGDDGIQNDIIDYLNMNCSQLAADVPELRNPSD